jgi:hypothetical protein
MRSTRTFDSTGTLAVARIVPDGLEKVAAIGAFPRGAVDRWSLEALIAIFGAKTLVGPSSFVIFVAKVALSHFRYKSVASVLFQAYRRAELARLANGSRLERIPANDAGKVP